jgi:hypothetical protein
MNKPFTDSLDTLPSDMQTALVSASSDAEAIVGKFLTKLEGVPTPATLYHYTDEAGMKGILASGHLWLTDILSLNDPSELTHGLAQAARVLNTKAARDLSKASCLLVIFRSLFNWARFSDPGSTFLSASAHKEMT